MITRARYFTDSSYSGLTVKPGRRLEVEVFLVVVGDRDADPPTVGRRHFLEAEDRRPTYTRNLDSSKCQPESGSANSTSFCH
jgi:hypothetical protein